MGTTVQTNKFKNTCHTLQNDSSFVKTAFSYMTAVDTGEDDGKDWAYVFPYDVVYWASYYDYVKTCDVYEILADPDFDGTSLKGMKYVYPND